MKLSHEEKLIILGSLHSSALDCARFLAREDVAPEGREVAEVDRRKVIALAAKLQAEWSSET